MLAGPLDRLRAAASGASIEPVFQPIVSLPDRNLVGFEALARWPRHAGLAPETVFDYARTHGDVSQLDQACITTALGAALEGDLHRETLLLINCEPSTPHVGPGGNAAVARAHTELNVVFELTERNLLTSPRGLLRKVHDIRGDGFALALDDVGAIPDSLALLDVLSPEIVKLDMTLTQGDPSEDHARILSGVLAHHERTGAVILAEGIESEEHLEKAQAVGASLGQGHLFGSATPLRPGEIAAPWNLPTRLHDAHAERLSPFDIVARTLPVRTGRKATLVALSRHIETLAHGTGDRPVVMAALQRAEHFTAATRKRYTGLAAVSPLVAVFGLDLPEDLGCGVRGVALHPSDPLCAEWIVLVLGSHIAATLIAREHLGNRSDTPLDDDRLFDVAISYDRSVVTAAARTLLNRMP